MSKKMLIDASHPEETRVVVVNGSRIDELDFESSNKRQLRGNVYLARVTRVEPSLQAAFVEYGGNRHGFLAFSEIHPDYYQIPYEDRMALLEAEEAENRAEEEDEDDESDDSRASESDSDEASQTSPDSARDIEDDELVVDVDVADADEEEVVEEQVITASSRRKRMSRRRYKIQEVIKRGQILLIQVVKEERGNKGAAMTTYLSLAGRYCVLMPNTPRGGGISRKIANGSDRKRLKSIVSEFDVPQGMGVIVRTAGAKRTKSEIKRDYDYLCRLWETTRETTLKSIAPALIHEEGNLVKRSIRDLYNKDISEVLVQGDEAYKTAKQFIKMLMPSHAKNVKAYKDEIPLFLRYHVESQIEDSLEPIVQLKSGGYLVIHPTEALVSVDVNSGRSTKERNVERTALKTNLEAADEVARQMRLRDLAGLVVIDFIDMDENRNNRAVEKRMKDALSLDRARVQSSRISQFGLMEISRQRRRRSLLEGSTAHCEHCGGVGRKRTVESSALRAIRGVEDLAVRRKAKRIRLKVAPDVALYIFNEKRDLLTAIDEKFDVFTELVGDDTLLRPAFDVDILEKSDGGADDPMVAIEKELKELDREAEKSAKATNNKRRRKSKKDNDEEEVDSDQELQTADMEDDEDQPKRRRRRGRRGGRRRKSETDSTISDTDEVLDDETPSDPTAQEGVLTEEKPKSKRKRRKSSKITDETQTITEDKDETGETSSDTLKEDKPRSTTRRKAPSRKPKSEDEHTDPQQKDDTSAASKSSRRRKAPARKKVEPEPQESTGTESNAATVNASDKPKSTRRRKAPTRKPKTEDLSVETATGENETPNAPDADTSAETVTKSTVRRSAPRRRKAPARNSDPESANELPGDETETLSTAARASDPVKTDMSGDDVMPESDEDKSSGKRSWWKRGKRK